MQKNDLERAKKLIKRLSSDDRKSLINFLAEFSDSGFQSYDLREELEVLKKRGQRIASPTDDPDHYLVNLVFVRNLVSVQIHDTNVLVAMFFPDNFVEAFPKLKAQTSIYSNNFKNMFTEERKKEERAARKAHGIEETEAEYEQDITKRCDAAAELWIMEKSKRIAAQISLHLPGMVGDMFAAAIKGQIFFDTQKAREELSGPDKKLSIEEFKKKVLDAHWREVKPHLGITQGGARNIKHIWTDAERTCLATNYKRLQPMWAEAKRIAVAAQRSKELTRSQRWREEVKRAYPELLDDLIERLSAPRSADSKPSDIALTHAASLCIPVLYSLRRLRDELKKFKALQFKSTS